MAYIGFVFALLSQSDRPEIGGTAGLFTLTLLYRWWESEKPLRQVKFNIRAIATGIVISLWLIFKALYYSNDEAFLRILPLLGFTSWSLLCYGWQSFQKLSIGFFLLGFLAFPWEIVYVVIDLSLLTTKLAHLFLTVAGLQAERISTLIRLGSGTIEVYHGCSGLKIMLQLVGFSLIYLVLNPQPRLKIIGFITGAIALGFTLNGFRVAMMAVLVSLGDEKAFDYWHLGTGSLIFSVVGLGCLALWGWQVQRWQNI
ncbi:hypothetical protein NIES208_02265 [[Limnothrix rosea] IAM M-220]|nr:hypothetical protein NIES208_02265 [[Limnothrix rosea] IAM M-220]